MTTIMFDYRCLATETHANRYEYQPIVRTVVELQDIANYFRPPYAKFKLELAYNGDSPAFLWS